jgi:hypothetical protein
MRKKLRALRAYVREHPEAFDPAAVPTNFLGTGQLGEDAEILPFPTRADDDASDETS